MSNTPGHRVLLRFKQALRVPPRDLARFAKRFSRELLAASDHILTAYAALQQMRSKSPVGSDHWSLMRKLGIANFSDVSSGLSTMGYTLHDIETVSRDGLDKLLATFFYSSREWNERALSAMNTLAEKITPGVIGDYLKDNDLEWNEKYEEGVPPAEILPYYDLAKALHEYVATYREAEKNWKALQPAWQKDMSALEPQKIETLYHASIIAKKIHESGFERTFSGDRGLGLGGSNKDKAGNQSTSFTYDLKYALDLARAFKELALVAHGKVTAKHILTWAKHEGTAGKVSDYLTRVEGGSRGSYRVVFENNQWVVRSYAGETQDINEFFDTPERVAVVYNAYLKTHSFRKDPFIMYVGTLVKNMKSVDPDGIGVVAAEVNMEHPDTLYNPGEREIRVPPEAILKTTRFYR